ncbi:MAG: hypothetical protein ACYCYK_12595 [Candidatus Dormibacteria bacterium]
MSTQRKVQIKEGPDSSTHPTREELLAGLERGDHISFGTLCAAVDDGRLTDDHLAPHLPDLSALFKSFTVQMPDISAMVRAQIPDRSSVIRETIPDMSGIVRNLSGIDHLAKSWNQNLSNATRLLNFDSVLGDLPNLAASISEFHIPAPDFGIDPPPSVMSSGATVDVKSMTMGPTVAASQLAVLQEVRADTQAMALIARASGEQIQAMAVNAETVKNEVRNQRWLTVILVLCTIALIIVAAVR